MCVSYTEIELKLILIVFIDSDIKSLVFIENSKEYEVSNKANIISSPRSHCLRKLHFLQIPLKYMMVLKLSFNVNLLFIYVIINFVTAFLENAAAYFLMKLRNSLMCDTRAWLS